MIRKILILFFLLLSSWMNGQVISQDIRKSQFKKDTLIVFAKIVNHDTIPMVQLPEVSIYAMRLFDSRRDIRRIERLIYHVKKVYPYAKLAGIKLAEYESILQVANSDRERRKIMKHAEDEINEQFGSDLRDLTFTQGKILIKLIDRETSETSFDLLKGMRGGFTAFFYQSFARIWGYNLKIKYDPNGEDELIETIILMIENGQL
jgi:protein associated with RNAse G/E